MTATHYFTGLASGLALIVAIGAQNTFVLRQGIRRQPCYRLPCCASPPTPCSSHWASPSSVPCCTATRHGSTSHAKRAPCFLLAYAGRLPARVDRAAVARRGGRRGATLRVALLSCLGFTFLNPHTYLDTVVLLGALGNQQGEEGRGCSAPAQSLPVCCGSSPSPTAPACSARCSAGPSPGESSIR